MTGDRLFPLFLVLAALFLPPDASQAGFPQASSPADRAAANRLAAEAQQLERQGDYAAAIHDLEQLVKIAPEVGEFRANLGMAYFSVHRFREATAEFRSALKLKPTLANASFLLGLSLAKSGDCKEALLELDSDYGRASDPGLKRKIGAQAVDCSISLHDDYRAADFVRRLSRDFPDNPDVLYLTSHFYSQLAALAADRLLVRAPASYQAHQMNAEVLDQQGQGEKAAQEYRKIIAANPDLEGMHYRLGRLLLEGPQTAQAEQAARQEFEAELKPNPEDAPSEYELGEMARKARQWDGAIEHFGRAAQCDPTLAEALIGLGKSLLSAGRAETAVAPLEKAVRLAPQDLVAHYQLSLAYRRLGRGAESDRETALYDRLHDKQASTMDAIAGGITGRVSSAQTAEPPEQDK